MAGDIPLAAFVPPSTPAQPHVDGGLTPVPEVQAPAPEAPHTPTDPLFSATPAGDSPASVGKQPDAVGRGDSSASSGSLADGSHGDPEAAGSPHNGGTEGQGQGGGTGSADAGGLGMGGGTGVGTGPGAGVGAGTGTDTGAAGPSGLGGGFASPDFSGVVGAGGGGYVSAGDGRLVAGANVPVGYVPQGGSPAVGSFKVPSRLSIGPFCHGHPRSMRWRLIPEILKSASIPARGTLPRCRCTPRRARHVRRKPHRTEPVKSKCICA